MSISQGNCGLDIGVVCSDSSIAVGKIVQGDGTDTTNNQKVVKVASASTQAPIGVTMDSTSSEDAQVTIRVEGIVDLVVDGSGTAIDIGTKIISEAAGVGIAMAAIGQPNQEVLGIALAPSSASGDRIPVLIARQSSCKGAA